jgi:small subunit ribosomal protein S21
MPGVRVKEGESLEQALRRFKKQCEKAGIFSDIRRSARYEKPSVRRKRKMHNPTRSKPINPSSEHNTM